MIRTVLLTGTRAPATLDLARRLWREGVRVVGADSMRFPLGRFSQAFTAHHRVPAPRQQPEDFIKAIADIARRESVDVIWPTCEEVFHLAAHRATLPESVRVLCPSMDVLELLHHKLRFAQWTHTLGSAVTAPESWAAEGAPSHADTRFIWKPCYSRFAVSTRLSPPKPPLEGWMAQRFIEGREFCTWAFCVAGQVRTLAQYRCPVRAGRGAGCAFEPYWSDAAWDFTVCVAHTLNYTGSLAFDFMESAQDGRTHVLECNPRLTSGLHVLSPEIRLRDLLSESAPIMSAPPPQSAAQLYLPVLFARPGLAGTSPDVAAAADDPVPSWTQGLAVAEFLWRTVRRRISVLEATTWDIEYNGD